MYNKGRNKRKGNSPKGVKMIYTVREILFKGKRVDNGEWTEGYLFKSWNKVFLLWGMTGDCPNMEEVIPKTVGQYTGLTDKNGKKIFEGDILLKGFEKVLVKWNANQCRWGIYSNNYEICGFNESTQGYFEVIGNIYDNSELLEVEE